MMHLRQPILLPKELDLTVYHMEKCAAIARLTEAAGLPEPYRRLTEKPDARAAVVRQALAEVGRPQGRWQTPPSGSGEVAADARGDADDHSDVDLLVVEQAVNDRYEEMVRLNRALKGLLMPVDLLVVSEQEGEHRSSTPGTVEHAARHEGRVLYAA